MRNQIIKVRNGLWEVHWEDGSKSQHSTEKGALQATIRPEDEDATARVLDKIKS